MTKLHLCSIVNGKGLNSSGKCLNSADFHSVYNQDGGNRDIGFRKKT